MRKHDGSCPTLGAPYRDDARDPRSHCLFRDRTRDGPGRLQVTSPGAVANVLVLFLFVVSAFMGNATIDALSLSGKAAQVMLGALLFWFVKRMGPPDLEKE